MSYPCQSIPRPEQDPCQSIPRPEQHPYQSNTHAWAIFMPEQYPFQSNPMPEQYPCRSILLPMLGHTHAGSYPDGSCINVWAYLRIRTLLLLKSKWQKTFSQSKTYYPIIAKANRLPQIPVAAMQPNGLPCYIIYIHDMVRKMLIFPIRRYYFIKVLAIIINIFEIEMQDFLL